MKKVFASLPLILLFAIGCCDCRLAPAAAAEPVTLDLEDQPAHVYEWRFWSADPGRLYLWRGNVQIGAYDLEKKYYRPYDARSDRWGPVSKPPVRAPLGAVPRMNFGVERDKLGDKQGYRIHRGGETHNLSSAAAREAMIEKLTDDTSKLRVTVIGSEGERQPVVADVNKAADIAGYSLVTDYPADHWAVTGAGFYTGGHPTIYCQAPSGKVLHRQDDYSGGIAELSKALRKAKEGYDAKKDPDLRKPQSPWGPGGGGLLRSLGLILSSILGVFGGDWAATRK